MLSLTLIKGYYAKLDTCGVVWTHLTKRVVFSFSPIGEIIMTPHFPLRWENLKKLFDIISLLTMGSIRIPLKLTICKYVGFMQSVSACLSTH